MNEIGRYLIRLDLSRIPTTASPTKTSCSEVAKKSSGPSSPNAPAPANPAASEQTETKMSIGKLALNVDAAEFIFVPPPEVTPEHTGDGEDEYKDSAFSPDYQACTCCRGKGYSCERDSCITLRGCVCTWPASYVAAAYNAYHEDYRGCRCCFGMVYSCGKDFCETLDGCVCTYDPAIQGPVSFVPDDEDDGHPEDIAFVPKDELYANRFPDEEKHKDTWIPAKSKCICCFGFIYNCSKEGCESTSDTCACVGI